MNVIGGFDCKSEAAQLRSLTRRVLVLALESQSRSRNFELSRGKNQKVCALSWIVLSSRRL
jgi:hypothetical protein